MLELQISREYFGTLHFHRISYFCEYFNNLFEKCEKVKFLEEPLQAQLHEVIWKHLHCEM